jgi:hypothetical protein
MYGMIAEQSLVDSLWQHTGAHWFISTAILGH